MTGTIKNIDVKVVKYLIGRDEIPVILRAKLFIDDKVNIEKFYTDCPKGHTPESTAWVFDDVKATFENFINNLKKSQIKTAAYLPIANYGEKIEKLWSQFYREWVNSQIEEEEEEEE